MELSLKAFNKLKAWNDWEQDYYKKELNNIENPPMEFDYNLLVHQITSPTMKAHLVDFYNRELFTTSEIDEWLMGIDAEYGYKTLIADLSIMNQTKNIELNENKEKT